MENSQDPALYTPENTALVTTIWSGLSPDQRREIVERTRAGQDFGPDYRDLLVDEPWHWESLPVQLFSFLAENSRTLLALPINAQSSQILSSIA